MSPEYIILIVPDGYGGFTNRDAYLEDLAQQFGIDSDVVKTLADAFGPSEDFDGLIGALEDWEAMDQ